MTIKSIKKQKVNASCVLADGKHSLFDSGYLIFRKSTSLTRLVISRFAFAKIENKFKNNTIMNKNQHVVPHNGQWAIKGENNEKATKVVDTQKEAIDIARKIAKNQEAELIIHRPNGQIRDKDSYGNDPFPPKG